MGKKRLTLGISRTHDKLPRRKESNLAAKKVTQMGAKLNFHSSSGQPEFQPKPFPIVGLGASAGGLEAFTDLLRHLPSDTGMALVLIQHLDPKHESMFPLLLSKATQMPVREAKMGREWNPTMSMSFDPTRK